MHIFCELPLLYHLQLDLVHYAAVSSVFWYQNANGLVLYSNSLSLVSMLSFLMLPERFLLVFAVNPGAYRAVELDAS